MSVDGEGAARPPHASRRPIRSSWRRSLIDVHPSLDTVLTAALAVGAVILVKFAVALVQLLGNAVDYNPVFYSNGFLASPVGLFLGSVVLYPFPFYFAAFVALVVFAPIVRTASLPLVLGRAVAAGAIGTATLALVGIATGILMALSSGNWISVALYVVFIPLAAGVLLTALLVGGSVLAWLWATRAAGADLGRAGAVATAGPRSGAPDPAAMPAAAADAAAAPAPSTPAAEPEAPVVPAAAPVSLPDSIFAPPADRG